MFFAKADLTQASRQVHALGKLFDPYRRAGTDAVKGTEWAADAVGGLCNAGICPRNHGAKLLQLQTTTTRSLFRRCHFLVIGTEGENGSVKVFDKVLDKVFDGMNGNDGMDSMVSWPRNLEEVMARIGGLPAVEIERLGPFAGRRRGDESSTPTGDYFLPRATISGPNSSDPIRIGVFAGIHGDEPAGTFAAIEFLRVISAKPDLAENYRLHVYPLCNPTGFEDGTRHSRGGPDLNRCFWQSNAEPEVRLIESDLRAMRFDGLIQLHADDTSEGVYGFVRGHTLSENLLKPALAAAGEVLPRNVNALIDGFAAKDGIIYDAYEGILASPEEIDPSPFEIILETPHHAPMEKQVEALVVAMRTVLEEYRRLIAFAANL